MEFTENCGCRANDAFTGITLIDLGFGLGNKCSNITSHGKEQGCISNLRPSDCEATITLTSTEATWHVPKKTTPKHHFCQEILIGSTRGLVLNRESKMLLFYLSFFHFRSTTTFTLSKNCQAAMMSLEGKTLYPWKYHFYS